MTQDSTTKLSLARTTGKLKWINELKGFGLITPDAGGKDLFAHFSIPAANAKPSGFRIAQKVSYDIRKGPDGEEAVNVRIIA